MKVSSTMLVEKIKFACLLACLHPKMGSHTRMEVGVVVVFGWVERRLKISYALCAKKAVCASMLKQNAIIFFNLPAHKISFSIATMKKRKRGEVTDVRRPQKFFIFFVFLLSIFFLRRKTATWREIFCCTFLWTKSELVSAIWSVTSGGVDDGDVKMKEDILCLLQLLLPASLFACKSWRKSLLQLHAHLEVLWHIWDEEQEENFHADKSNKTRNEK